MRLGNDLVCLQKLKVVNEWMYSLWKISQIKEVGLQLMSINYLLTLHYRGRRVSSTELVQQPIKYAYLIFELCFNCTCQQSLTRL